MLTGSPIDNCLVMVDEDNKSSMHHQAQPNALYFFELNEWYATNAFRNFSVKFVLDGMINYKIANKSYFLKEKQVLIANRQPDVHSYFESRKSVKSICLNFDGQLIASTYAVYAGKGNADPERLLGNPATIPDFHEILFPVQAHDFLEPLHVLAKQLCKAPQKRMVLNEEFFLNLSENIILQIFQTNKIDGLAGLRFSIRKEILRRLEIGQDWLRTNLCEKPSVARLARICNMSQYHFFRAFKQAYKMTPYQFQLKLRLEKARGLMVQDGMDLTQVAASCAFPDLATFSKAFKRAYQISPSIMRNLNTTIKPN